MKFTDRATVTGLRKTADGYMVGEVRCARTGCQTYHGSEIGLVDAGMITVYRPEEAVFAKDSMATFAGKPVTVGHPAEPVTADNWKTHAVGDIGEADRDGEFVRVPIKLMAAAAIQAVQDGIREISMGYTTPLEVRGGVAPDGTKYQAVQTGPIRINHLALVPKARGGSELRIGDGADQWGAAPVITTSKPKGDTMSDALKTVVLGDQAAQVAADSVGIIDKFKAEQAKTLADAIAAKDATIEEKDEEIGKLKADLAAAKKQIPTSDALDTLVAERAALLADAEKLAGIKDATGTVAEIRKAIVANRLGDEAVADASDAEITGMFKAVKAAGAQTKDAFADTMRTVAPVKDAATDAYTQMLADMQSAYKQAPAKEA